MSKKFIIIASLFSLILVLGWIANITAQISESQKVLAAEDTKIEANSQKQEATKVIELPNTQEKIKVKEFYLEIPAAEVSRKVTPNVDPSDPNIYLPVLEHTIAHGKYTLLPSQATKSGNIYLFAHRGGKDGFRDFGYFRDLDKLKAGDKAVIKFNGKKYTYKYRTSKIVSPAETSVYTAYSPTPTLTLQTCEEGISKRLIVTFDLVSID